jgi:hypothetical protein
MVGLLQGKDLFAVCALNDQGVNLPSANGQNDFLGLLRVWHNMRCEAGDFSRFSPALPRVGFFGQGVIFVVSPAMRYREYPVCKLSLQESL